MKTNPVNWFEIYVSNMDRARSFYEYVLGTTLSKLEVPGNQGELMYTFPMEMDVPNASGALVHFPNAPVGGSGTIVYFTCADCAMELSRVTKAGGTVFKDKFSIGPYGFVGLAKDTEGNMFGLHSTQ